MIQTGPMPDEIAAGHMGRLRWLNEWRNGLTATQSLHRALVADEVEAKDPSAFYLLAAASNITPTDYARLHSMLPASRLAFTLGAGAAHGSIRATATARALGLALPRGLPLACIDCIREDLDHWGFSWYRRSHQLVGVDWCDKHGRELVRVHSRDPFWLTPHWHVQAGATSWVGAYVEQLPDASELVERYVAIASAALLLAAPLPSRLLNARLARRIEILELRLGESSRAGFSDWIAARAPSEWLSRHFPDIGSSRGREAAVDRLLRHLAFAPEGQHYILAMAALYENADAALHDVFGVTSGRTTSAVADEPSRA